MADIPREHLRAYLDDALGEAETAAVERALRDTPALQKELRLVMEERDRGEHSVGAIWRRERLSCPTRDQLGGHLLGAIDPALQEYVEFHLTVVGCAFCQANLADLQAVQTAAAKPATRLRRKIINSGTSLLPNQRPTR
jgi:hypothetical protein